MKIFKPETLMKNLTDYLSNAFQDDEDTSSKTYHRNSDGSVTHRLSFLIETEDGSEKEIYFYINCNPIDEKKEFVNISFKYPDPNNLKSKNFKDLLTEVDRYKAVPNKQDVIVKKCLEFISKIYDVDAIEELPENLEASEVIEGSTYVTGALNFLSTLKSKLVQWFSNLFEDKDVKGEINVVKSSKGRHGELMFDAEMIAYKNDKPYLKFPSSIKLEPTDDKKTQINLYVRFPEKNNLDNLGDEIEYSDVVNNDKDVIFQRIWEMFWKMDYDPEKFAEKFGVEESEEEMKNTETTQTTEEEVASSMETNKLKVSLQKVHSGTQVSVRLKGIHAACDIAQSSEIIDDITNDSEFVESMPFDDISNYSVDVVDDGYELETLETFDANDAKQLTYNSILDVAYKFLFDCQFAGYTASGPEMSKIQNYVMNYTWKVQDLIDTVSKMVLEDSLYLIHPCLRIQNLRCVHDVNDFTTWRGFVECMKRNIDCLIGVLDLYRCNLSDDKQESVLNWIRTWSYESNYCLDRSLLSEVTE